MTRIAAGLAYRKMYPEDISHKIVDVIYSADMKRNQCEAIQHTFYKTEKYPMLTRIGLQK